MPTPKSSALDEILSNHDDSNDHYEPEGRPGRRPGQPKTAAKPQARNTQAWRAIEDMKENRRLDSKLKEVYEEE